MLSPTLGRVLSAVGAVVVAIALALTWYHIVRTTGATDDTTGWQTFTRLRWVVLAGAALVLVTAVLRQTRPVLALRTIVGVVLALLILRRIVDPPQIDGDLSSQFGVWVGLVAALVVATGGLVDSGRAVVESHPEMAFWREPAGRLGPGAPDEGDRSRVHAMPPAGGPGGADGSDGRRGAAIDSTAEEI